MQTGVKNQATNNFRTLMTRVCKAVLDGKLVETVDKIAGDLYKDGQAPQYFDTIEQERLVATKQIQAILGHVIHPSEPLKKPLSEYAKETLARPHRGLPNGATIINDGCHKCKALKYYVTDACEGCVARPCITNCPKKAISRVGGKAQIDQKLCISCGMCAKNCPYDAILNRKVPCMDDCPVDAISKDKDNNSVVDPAKCIHCGRCTIRCPFGVIVMPSQIIDVLQRIKEGKKVVAMPAPAAMVQFNGTVAQLRQACLKLGFSDMVEVALGADTTSITEAQEFLEHVATGKQPLMATSCCPAWVRAVRVHIPELAGYVSNTGSPMKYTGDLVKQKDPEAITVFVGPCTAKRTEASYIENTDYVLTSEELQNAFAAAEIDVVKMPKEDKLQQRLPSQESTVYCLKEAVTAAVVSAVPKATDRIKEHGEEHESGGKAPIGLKPIFVSPLDKKSFKQVKLWGSKPSTIPGNLIECMCCDGGCVAGPGNMLPSTSGGAKAKALLKDRPLYKDIEDVTSLN